MIARLFAQEGASVIAIARRKEKRQSAIDEITAQGDKAITVSRLELPRGRRGLLRGRGGSSA